MVCRCVLFGSGCSTDPYWRLIDPRGQVVFGPSRVGDIEEPPLPLTGTYTLLVEGRIPTGAPQTLDFRVGAMSDGSAALTLGERTAGTLAAAGARLRSAFPPADRKSVGSGKRVSGRVDP